MGGLSSAFGDQSKAFGGLNHAQGGLGQTFGGLTQGDIHMQDPIKYASTRAALAGSNPWLQEGRGKTEEGKKEVETRRAKDRKEGERKDERK